VRITNETSHKYVANLKRVSDGPPNEGTSIAFIPEVSEVHDGVRVNVLSSRLKGTVLSAKVTIEQNQLLSFITTRYTESVKSQSKEKADEAVVKTSLLDRLRPEHAGSTSISGTINIPQMASSRIEGEWLIPSEGALLISMGPRSRHDKGLLQSSYEERLVAITARPTTEALTVAETAPTTPPTKAPTTP